MKKGVTLSDTSTNVKRAGKNLLFIIRNWNFYKAFLLKKWWQNQIHTFPKFFKKI